MSVNVLHCQWFTFKDLDSMHSEPCTRASDSSRSLSVCVISVSMLRAREVVTLNIHHQNKQIKAS